MIISPSCIKNNCEIVFTVSSGWNSATCTSIQEAVIWRNSAKRKYVLKIL